MTDNVVPYSAIGYADFICFAPDSKHAWVSHLDEIPAEFSFSPYWQYEWDPYSFIKRLILGSVAMDAETEHNNNLSDRHRVLEEQRQWVTGDNVTLHANVDNIGALELFLSSFNVIPLPILLLKYTRYS